MSRPTVTELLSNLKQQKQQNLDLTESEDINVNQTITEVHSEEESDHQDLYDMIEQLSQQIEKLEKRVSKIEDTKTNEKYYKETIDYVEQNKTYNDFFNIPLEQRTYKPLIKKEEISKNNLKIFNVDDNKIKKDNIKKNIRKSKSKNHRKYK